MQEETKNYNVEKKHDIKNLLDQVFTSNKMNEINHVDKHKNDIIICCLQLKIHVTIEKKKITLLVF